MSKYPGILVTAFTFYLLFICTPIPAGFFDHLELVIYDQHLEIMSRQQRNEEHRMVIIE